MMYVATINIPGYLPMDDNPPVFETAQEAWDYLREERERGEDAVYDGEPDADGYMGYSPVVEELTALARWAGSGLVCDFEAVGTVWGGTPGYEGDHDLGLAYSVTEVEEDSDATR